MFKKRMGTVYQTTCSHISEESYENYYILIRVGQRPIILPVVLYGCETWSLTLREEHRGCLRTGC
jgi:hypothetical protein